VDFRDRVVHHVCAGCLSHCLRNGSYLTPTHAEKTRAPTRRSGEFRPGHESLPIFLKLMCGSFLNLLITQF
jgi:hypothetical protein